MNRLILRSLISGVILSFGNFFWMYFGGNDNKDEPSPIQIVELFLIGFIYAIVVSFADSNPFNRKKFIFILLSGFLYLVGVFGSSGAFGIPPHNIFGYCLMSGVTSMILFLFYYSLIDTDLQFKKGMGISFALGFVAGIIPGIWQYSLFHANHKADFDEIGSVMIIFMFWQPLFALSVTLSKKKKTIS